MSLVKDTQAKSLDVAFKCGECLHHKQHAHPSYKKICESLGVRGTKIAPPCFTPDVTQLAGNTDVFVQLASMLQDFKPKQKRVLYALLRMPQKKFKKDFPLGTKVYFHGLGGDYISNYLSGFVYGTTSSGELIISGSPDVKTRGKSYLAYMSDDQELMTFKEWKAKRKQLELEGKIHDPKAIIMPRDSLLGQEPITIDNAPNEWHTKQEKKKKKKGIQDLTMTII